MGHTPGAHFLLLSTPEKQHIDTSGLHSVLREALWRSRVAPTWAGGTTDLLSGAQHCSLQGITAYRPPPTGTKSWAATRKPSRAAGPPLGPGRRSAQGAGPGGRTRGHQRERARGRARRGAVQNDHALSCGTSGPGASGGRVCHLVLCATHGLPQDLPACLPTLRGGEGQWRNALPITAAQLSPFHPGPPGPPGTARQRTAAARHPGPGLGRRRVQALWGPSGSLPPWRTK